MYQGNLFLISQGLIDPSFVTLKSKSTSNCSFSVLPPLFPLPTLSFTIHYICVTGSRRIERGKQCVVTLSAALQLSAWLRLLLPAGCERGKREGGAGGQTNPSTITTTRINRSATPYKRSTEAHASHNCAPPTMTSHVAQMREGAQIGGKVNKEMWRRKKKTTEKCS